MSDTARDLIAGSLRLLGVTASGEAAADNESADGLSALNDMIDSWSTERLLIPNKVREVFPLVASKGAYTMGSGADFDTTRPMEIEDALIQLSSENPVVELPMKILTKDEWAGIILKTLPSTFPLYLYAEGTYPNETVNVWPVPSEVNNLVFYSWKPLSNLATLSTALSLPPGYRRALRYNLAVDLAPEYGRAIPEAVAAIAADAKANIKRKNTKPEYLRVDDALMGRPAIWNWRTGEPT